MTEGRHLTYMSHR